MNLLGSDQLNAFDENDIITLEAVASQLSVAITNRNLYSGAKDFNLKLQHAVEEKTIELRKAHDRILEQQKLLQKQEPKSHLLRPQQKLPNRH